MVKKISAGGFFTDAVYDHKIATSISEIQTLSLDGWALEYGTNFAMNMAIYLFEDLEHQK